MYTIVYLSNQQIEIINGKKGKTATVNEHLSLTAPEGTVINGIVMDNECFIAFLKEQWAIHKLPHKNVILVVNSTKFVGQTMELPAMTNDRTLEYIRRNFANIDKDEEKIYGFAEISRVKNKMRRLYAESIPVEYVKDLNEIFAQADIKVKGMYSAEGCMIVLVNRTLAKYYNNFIVMLADGLNLGTMLFTGREYTYSSSVRCFHDQGTEEYAQDLVRSAGQIGQFLKANHIECELEGIVLAGINEKDVDIYRANIKAAGIATEVSIFCSGTEINGNGARNAQEFLPAVSGLFEADGCNDFLKQLQERKTVKTHGESRKYLLPIGITAAAMITAFFISFIIARSKRAEYERIDEFNNSGLVISQVERYDDLTQRNNFLVGQYLSIAGINENLDTYPWATSDVVAIIEKLAAGYADISITSCNADNGTTNLSVMADDPQKISDFAGMLKGQSIFYDVTYTGYTYTNSGRYQVNVSCILSEAAGRDGGRNEN